MQKDVIYIDVEDDITAIIGKVKNSKEKIVAVVPPKRIGVLQSAVNLRLLARAATGAHKHLVLITNNQALIALSAAAKIPVAKNLQSKPELPETSAADVENDEDVIDGAELPVGELAKTAAKTPNDDVSDQILKSIDTDTSSSLASPPKPGEPVAKARVRSGVKVPSFNVFRKKLFILVGLGVLFVGFLIWAIFFSAQATVIIDARTTPTDVKTAVAIGPDLATNAETGALKSVVQTDKKSETIEFDATGTQEIGDKATGTITITRVGVSASATEVPLGTAFSSGDYTFTTTTATSVPRSQIVGSGIDHGSVTVNVAAQAVGEEYNLSARSYSSSMDGFSASGSQMSGGTKRTIKIVVQADVEKAKTQLVSQSNDEAKKKLQAKFDKNTILIDDSFQATPAAPVSTPAVGGELKDGKAKLVSEVVYTMSGISKADLGGYLKSALEKQLDTDQQRVYEDGVKGAKLSGFTQNNGNTSITLETTGQIGPKINDEAIKEMVKGKKFAEIREELKKIEGVNDVETKFSPFWVNTVPNDTKKIKIEFKLKNESKG